MAEFSSKYRDSRRRNKCCVNGCGSTMDKDTNLSLHTFPNSGIKVTRINLFEKPEIVDKRSEWLRKLQLQDTNKNMNVCSKYFKPGDYCFPDIDASVKKKMLFHLL